MTRGDLVTVADAMFVYVWRRPDVPESDCWLWHWGQLGLIVDGPTSGMVKVAVADRMGWTLEKHVARVQT